MIDPWITKSVLMLATYREKRKIRENLEHIQKNLDSLGDQVDKIGKKIDEEKLSKLREANSRLQTALRSPKRQVRNREFARARDLYSELSSLDPNEKTVGTSGTIDNSKLICYGYAGSFMYFCEVGDDKNALIQAYMCVEKFPLIALHDLDLFPSELFSKEYPQLFRKGYQTLSELRKRRKEREGNYNRDRITYRGKQVVWAGEVLLSVATAIAVRNPGPLHGVKWVMDDIQANPFELHDLNNVFEIDKAIDLAERRLIQLQNELKAECSVRKESLEQLSDKQMKEISYQTDL